MLLNFKKIKLAIQLFSKAFRGHKSKLLLMTILGLAGGFLGGIGISAVIPLFAFLVGETTNDFVSQTIIKIFSFLGLPYNLPVLLISIALVFITKAALLFVANYLNAKASVDYERETRNLLFKQTIKADWTYLLHQKVGYLQTILFDDINGSSGFFNGVKKILTHTNLL